MDQDRTTTRLSFIEKQLPVSRLSKECYKERKAGPGQRLTPLGSYWKGRKPLLLVRATILGCLLPSTSDPVRDREIFLKLLLMDEEGLRKRRTRSIPAAVIARHLTPEEWRDCLETDARGGNRWARGAARDDRAQLQEMAFDRMGYDERMDYCLRPEEMPAEAWDSIWPEVNAHLGTTADSIAALVRQLGERQFGHAPRVADTFCGGGSIPFEAARIGCEVYASDLNPIAAMLTWGALNIVGGSEELGRLIREKQVAVAAAVRAEIDDLGVETGEDGWRGKVYLYCLETRCPETDWMVPLAPNWLISATHRVVAKLVPDESKKRFDIQIVHNASSAELEEAKLGTVREGFMYHPHPSHSQVQIRMSTIRGDSGSRASASNRLRKWEKGDFEPAPDDIYQERLYCIQWIQQASGESSGGATEFRTVTDADLRREDAVRKTVAGNISEWQQDGLIPDTLIEPGEKTDEPIRTRGWTHWHHLFNARQLLTLALYRRQIALIEEQDIQVAIAIVLCKTLDWSNKLCRWDPSEGHDHLTNLFYNQAFNTMLNYGTRGFSNLQNHFQSELPSVGGHPREYAVITSDAVAFKSTSDIVITDPPYGDAINYHEITEFFIAWFRGNPPKKFVNWTWDSRRPLAVQGNDLHFRKTMVESYTALAEGMPENGIQVVMFTHSNPAVWAGIAQILWGAGLQVTAAWCIGTETTGGVRQGNLVQGTVLLVLRKRLGQENAWSQRLRPRIKEAVKKHLVRMRALDDKERPNFADADYQLAAYAAALEVLTQYKTLDDQDVLQELLRPDDSASKSTIVSLLDEAKRIASDFLIPSELGAPSLDGRQPSMTGADAWQELSNYERFFLKGLELEAGGENRVGAFQDIARGFGVDDYRVLMGNSGANTARLKTAWEFKTRDLKRRGESDEVEDAALAVFASSVVRHALFGIYKAMESEDLRESLRWFGDSMPEYWDRRKLLLTVLEFISRIRTDARVAEAEVAQQLAVAVNQDSR